MASHPQMLLELVVADLTYSLAFYVGTCVWSVL